MKLENKYLIVFLMISFFCGCVKTTNNVVSTSVSTKKYYFNYILNGTEYKFSSDQILNSDTSRFSLCAVHSGEYNIYGNWYDSVTGMRYHNVLWYSGMNMNIGDYQLQIPYSPSNTNCPISEFDIYRYNTNNGTYDFFSAQNVNINVTKIESFGGVIEASFYGEFKKNNTNNNQVQIISGAFSVYKGY